MSKRIKAANRNMDKSGKLNLFPFPMSPDYAEYDIKTANCLIFKVQIHKSSWTGYIIATKSQIPYSPGKKTLYP